MIVIAGDSWGCGEWHDLNLTHGVLAQYLLEDNHNVINLSVHGSSNWEIYERLDLFFKSGIPKYLKESIELVLVFQTEWIRDLSLNKLSCGKEHARTNAIACWQYRLSEVAVKNNVKIGLIGGCSDTVYFDYFEKEHPGVFIACQSFTNLCAGNNDRVDDPTFFVRPDNDVLKKLGAHYKKYSSIDLLSDDIDRGISRDKIWKIHPKWFYPDGNHANRHAHKKLYDYLKTTKVI